MQILKTIQEYNNGKKQFLSYYVSILLDLEKLG